MLDQREWEEEKIQGYTILPASQIHNNQNRPDMGDTFNASVPL